MKPASVLCNNNNEYLIAHLFWKRNDSVNDEVSSYSEKCNCSSNSDKIKLSRPNPQSWT